MNVQDNIGIYEYSSQQDITNDNKHTIMFTLILLAIYTVPVYYIIKPCPTVFFAGSGDKRVFFLSYFCLPLASAVLMLTKTIYTLAHIHVNPFIAATQTIFSFPEQCMQTVAINVFTIESRFPFVLRPMHERLRKRKKKKKKKKEYIPERKTYNWWNRR